MSGKINTIFGKLSGHHGLPWEEGRCWGILGQDALKHNCTTGTCTVATCSLYIENNA